MRKSGNSANRNFFLNFVRLAHISGLKYYRNCKLLAVEMDENGFAHEFSRSSLSKFQFNFNVSMNENIFKKDRMVQMETLADTFIGTLLLILQN